MSDDKEFDPTESNLPSAEQGTEAHASDPASHDDELTVDDILGAEQTPSAAEADAPEADAPEAEADNALLNDLKRVQAEFANYRRRTEDQRELEKQRAKGEVIKNILPVLDDLDRADQHGDLIEGSAFFVIAEKVRALAVRQGAEAFGAVGDVFDPQRHEAIFQQPTPGATEITIIDVVEVGYQLGDVELRPAKVVVAVPAE